MAQRASIDEGPMWRGFLVFLLPLIGQNILQTLAMTLNLIVVGHMLGTGALASVATFMPLAFFFLAFVIGITAGASVLVGQAWGARNLPLLRRIAGTAVGATLVLGLIIGGLGFALAPRLLDWIGTPADVRAQAIDYARGAFLGMPVMFLFVTLGALLRGTRDSMRPLIVQAVVTALSVALTVMMVGRQGLGVEAAAWSVGIAQAVAVALLLAWLRAEGHPLAPSVGALGLLVPDAALLWRVLRLGLPTGAQLVVGSLSGLVLVGLVNSFGSDATAAYGAVSQVQAYAQFPALSIGIAASIFGAQAIGAGRADLLARVLRTAMTLNLLLTGALVLLIYAFSETVVSAFTSRPEVIELAQRLLHMISWSSLLFGAGTIFAGLMRASGTVIPPMLIAMGSILLVELPLAIVMSRSIGLVGIWTGYIGGFVALALVQGAYYMLVWRRKRITSLV